MIFKDESFFRDPEQRKVRFIQASSISAILFETFEAKMSSPEHVFSLQFLACTSQSKYLIKVLDSDNY